MLKLKFTPLGVCKSSQFVRMGAPLWNLDLKDWWIQPENTLVRQASKTVYTGNFELQTNKSDNPVT